MGEEDNIMSIWTVSETTMVKNTKFLRLSRTLEVGIAETIGLLTLLWHCVLEMKEDGDITNWNDDDIECYAHWEGKRGVFAKALFKEDHRFIDKIDGKNLIHDWTETAGRYLIKRYGTANKNRLIEIWTMYGKTYGRREGESESKSKQQKSGKKFPDESSEIKASQYLFIKIKENDPNAKEPDYQKWAIDIDGIIRLDKRTKEELKAVIDWCQKDEFWKINILSAKSLRKHFPKLKLKMESEHGKGNSKKKSGYSFKEEKFPTLNKRGVRPSDSRT
jgi:hypothetical protein